jgi:uncharacterized metal-binding protein (TIGR02443 family)
MTLKRFIAGAVCPQCQLADKIVVYQEADTAYCECVRCGYLQQQPVAATAPPAMPEEQASKPAKAPAPQEHVIRLHKKAKG